AETVEETGPSEPVTATDATTAPGAAFTSEAAAESTISPADDVLAASGGPAADFSATEFTSTAFSATASFVAAPSNVVELPARQPTPAPEVDPPTSLAPPAPPVFRAPTLAAPPPTFQRLMAAAAVPPGREPSAPAERVEMARVDAELLNQLLNQAGEVSIARSRVEQQLGSVEFNLGELSRTVTRLKEQLSKLEIETEAQILHRHETEMSSRADRGDFDPLELDRYSSIKQFSRAL